MRRGDTVGVLMRHNMTHVGERLLAGFLVSGDVGGARPRHGFAYRVNFVARYLTHLFFDGRYAERRRLNPHARADACRHKWPGCGNGFDPGIDACLHTINVVRAGAGMARRKRCAECRSAPRHQSQNVHDAVPHQSYSNVEIRFQSLFMLITVPLYASRARHSTTVVHRQLSLLHDGKGLWQRARLRARSLFLNVCLLALVFLYHLLNLGLDRLEVE